MLDEIQIVGLVVRDFKIHLKLENHKIHSSPQKCIFHSDTHEIHQAKAYTLYTLIKYKPKVVVNNILS